MAATKVSSRIASFFREEWFLPLSFATMAVFWLKGGLLFADLPDPVGFALIFIWLFAVVRRKCRPLLRPTLWVEIEKL
jgi:hypothetical protein